VELLDRALRLGAETWWLDPVAIDRDPKGHLDTVFGLRAMGAADTTCTTW
jgi:hypothetical protein